MNILTLAIIIASILFLVVEGIGSQIVMSVVESKLCPPGYIVDKSGFCDPDTTSDVLDASIKQESKNATKLENALQSAQPVPESISGLAPVPTEEEEPTPGPDPNRYDPVPATVPETELTIDPQAIGIRFNAADIAQTNTLNADSDVKNLVILIPDKRLVNQAFLPLDATIVEGTMGSK